MGKILKIVNFWAAGLSLLFLSSCSTQKNTWATRSFHQTKVSYNILHNGNIKYEEGLKAIRDAHTDDYTQVLPLYPVSDHQAAEAATATPSKPNPNETPRKPATPNTNSGCSRRSSTRRWGWHGYGWAKQSSIKAIS